jgi:hypothetical protein
MADDYPYMMSNNKIKPIIDAIHDAAKPAKFSHEFLKQIGFSSSNDRAVIPLFKRLGILNDNGSPTHYYDDLKDITKRDSALGSRIRELYSDLYAINTKIHEADEDTIKGAISRVTGKDATSVGRYFTTFKTICGLAKFEVAKPVSVPPVNVPDVPDAENGSENGSGNGGAGQIPASIPGQAGFHYNIQIHLPATTDISVYNAIFKSLKDNLII